MKGEKSPRAAAIEGFAKEHRLNIPVVRRLFSRAQFHDFIGPGGKIKAGAVVAILEHGPAEVAFAIAVSLANHRLNEARFLLWEPVRPATLAAATARVSELDELHDSIRLVLEHRSEMRRLRASTASGRNAEEDHKRRVAESQRRHWELQHPRIPEEELRQVREVARAAEARARDPWTLTVVE